MLIKQPAQLILKLKNGNKMSAIPNTSNLFYQTRLRRPMLDRAEGVYLWDTTGKRYLDGSSGAMVSNIGHSNPVVLDAMKRQMDKSTFGYRLHFENEPAEQFATGKYREHHRHRMQADLVADKLGHQHIAFEQLADNKNDQH